MIQVFYEIFGGLILANDYLIYNVEKAGVCSIWKGKLAISDSEKQIVGHLIGVLLCLPVEKALRPLIIFPSLLNFPDELIWNFSHNVFLKFS